MTEAPPEIQLFLDALADALAVAVLRELVTDDGGEEPPKRRRRPLLTGEGRRRERRENVEETSETAVHRDALDAALDLEATPLVIPLPPRLLRRLRCRAYAEGRRPEALAALLVARALVPDAAERAQLVRRDFAALGLIAGGTPR